MFPPNPQTFRTAICTHLPVGRLLCLTLSTPKRDAHPVVWAEVIQNPQLEKKQTTSNDHQPPQKYPKNSKTAQKTPQTTLKATTILNQQQL